MSPVTVPAKKTLKGSPTIASGSGGPATGRFLWVDAIRGLACVAVVLRHLGFPASSHAGLALLFPAWLMSFHTLCAAGVYAFFVLSGFVIAHSLRANALDGRSVGNFILRRQVRLDPVYWVAMLLGLLAGALHSSVPNFFINALYLQGLLNKKQIIGPSWTLCLEIQFYLVFIAVLVAGRFARRMTEGNNATTVSVGLLFVTGLLSLGLKLSHVFFAAIFISYWHYFVLGVLSYYAVKGVVSLRAYYGFLGAFFVALVFSPLDKIADFGTQHSLALASMLVALLTAISLVYAALNGRMEKWGNTPILQYLGRISYTLYLTHTLVIYMVTSRLSTYANEKWPSLGVYALCIAVSIGIAHVLHLLVERPTMKWASRLKSS